MVLLQLFWAFTKISLFAIGGAYSFLPLLEREIVENYHWLTQEEFLEALAAVRILPGAISVKYASYVGYKIAGIPGVVIANLGNILVPSLLIIFILSLFVKYKDVPAVKGAFNMIHMAVFAMIIAVAFKIVDVKYLVQLRSFLVIVISFTLFVYTKVHPAFIIIGAGILGALLK